MPLEVDEEELEEPADDTVPISTTAANTTRADGIWAETLDSLFGPMRLPLREQSSVSNIFPRHFCPLLLSLYNIGMKKSDIWLGLTIVAQEIISCPPN